MVKTLAGPNDNGDKNIFHCCIEKTASRWMMQIMADPMVQEKTGLEFFNPGRSYTFPTYREDLKAGFPLNTIVSPLYITYEAFSSIKKPINYKAFFVMRDPRDLLVSRYFSRRYSHPILNEVQEKEKKRLNEISFEDGIDYLIELLVDKHKPLYFTMTPWIKAYNPAVFVCRYEDLVGKNQIKTFQVIFKHCEIALPKRKLVKLLKKYSFEKLAKGRKQGREDPKSHYRKGIPGDWQNHFNSHHKDLFKKHVGPLLIDLGYEKDNNW